MLTSREIATAFWLIAPLMWMIAKHPKIRGSAVGLLKAFLDSKILATTLLSFGALGLIVAWPIAALGLWQAQTIKATGLWVLAVGLPILFKAHAIQSLGSFLRQEIYRKLDISILIGFVFNVYVFSLWVEFILVPLVTIMVLLHQFTLMNKSEGYDETRRFLGWLMTAGGIIMALYVLGRVLENPERLASSENISLFLLAILLTIVYLPIVFCLGVYMRYESMFKRIETFWPNAGVDWQVRWRCIKRCGLRLGQIQSLQGVLVREGTLDRDKNELLAIIGDF